MDHIMQLVEGAFGAMLMVLFGLGGILLFIPCFVAVIYFAAYKKSRSWKLYLLILIAPILCFVIAIGLFFVRSFLAVHNAQLTGIGQSEVHSAQNATGDKRCNIILIDKSKSMTDVLLETKSSALNILQSLPDDEYVSVIGFDRSPFVVWNLKKVVESRPSVESRLKNLSTAGDSYFIPALERALLSFDEQRCTKKMLTVISDGNVTDAEGDLRIRKAILEKAAVTLQPIYLRGKNQAGDSKLAAVFPLAER